MVKRSTSPGKSKSAAQRHSPTPRERTDITGQFLIGGSFTVVARNTLCMASEKLRELARKHPESFRRIVQAEDDAINDHLTEVLREEQSKVNQQRVSAD